MIEQIIDEMQVSLTKLRGSLRSTGKAGECVKNKFCVCKSCMDEYFKAVIGKAYKEEWEKQHPPDLPLHVRVAKALKKHVMNGDIGWVYFEDNMPYPIPDYPNDLVAAMGALEEYREKYGLVGESIIDGCGGWFFRLTDDFAKLYTTGGYSAETLPQAICEAIVAYAEGK